MTEVLPQSFYCRDPLEVAVSLLGKRLVRIFRGVRLSGTIVEAEAYYGEWDPASRAKRGGDLARVMRGECGVALVYGVHRSWLLNVVAHEEGEAGAVLIRAIEPLEGVGVMVSNRGVRSLRKLTSGPGRLTRALAVDKSFHGKPFYTTRHGLWIEDAPLTPPTAIGRSRRVGVGEDLEALLRVFIKGNPFVSRR